MAQSGATPNTMRSHDLSLYANLSRDIRAGIAVFFVALPLCLGVALASGAPLLGGIIAGIVGGVLVGILSGSELSVSGPAAGLAVTVAASIQTLGNYENFLAAVILAGVMQVILSSMRAGVLNDFVPAAVIRGMLAAIGIVIIMKQIPHALGRDGDFEGNFGFLEPTNQPNALSEIARSIVSANPEAIIIALLSFFVILAWESPKLKKNRIFKIIPSALVVVILGVVVNESFRLLFDNFFLRAEDGHLVQLPGTLSFAAFTSFFHFPNFSVLTDAKVYSVAATVAVVASLESLLSLEAVDKLDPFRRVSEANKELRAQGIGNIVSGLLGGLPITSVIVRSSANVYAGARTRLSAIVHGILLVISVLFLAPLLNKIPLAALAAILIIVGYKLAPPKLFVGMYQGGKEQFVPFITTVIAIVFTDLLTGIAIGLCVSMFFLLRANYQSAVALLHEGSDYTLRFTKDMSFINKSELKQELRKVPNDSHLIIDGGKAHLIDADIYDTVFDFTENAKLRGITIEYRNFIAKEPSVITGH